MSDYKLRDADAKRLGELLDNPDISNLSAEIALCRLAAEKAARDGHTALLATLLQTLARLCSQHSQREYQRGELLSRAAVLKVASELCEAVLTEFRECCEGWELRAERVAQRVLGVVGEAENPTIEGPSDTRA